LREHHIPLKKKTEMKVRYQKRSFIGSLEEMAYLVGFRLGDLNVYRPSINSKIVVARCHTTVSMQANLIRSLFKKYGGVRVVRSSNGITINCFLNLSFGFLLPKIYPQWIQPQSKPMAAFTAGYTDAEGSFGVYQGRGRFKLDSYDYQILRNIYRFLIIQGIHAKFWCIAKRNTANINGGRWRHDLWRINVNEAKSLVKFIRILLPHLRHHNRIQQAHAVLKNIQSRSSFT